MNWQNLNSFDLKLLQATRLQLHHAVQISGMFGRTYSPVDPGDAFGNLGWLTQEQGMGSHQVWEGTNSLVLRFSDLTLLWLDREQTVEEYSLMNSSLRQGIQWVNQRATNHQKPSLQVDLPYEVDDYQDDFTFSSFDTSIGNHFAQLFSNTQQLLQQIATQYTPTEPIRCWPHHFDLATRLILKAHPDPELESSIGLGFSPGDHAIPQPYFYVNCWPYPQLNAQQLPDLGAHGRWNLEGWVGTTLAYDTFAGKEDQQSIVTEYLTRSIESLRALLI